VGAYIVDQAQQIKSDIPGKKPGLTFQVIKLGLRDGDGQAPTVAEWFTPESTPLPAQGSTLEGTLELGDYGWTFKKSKSANNGGGQRGDLSPEAQARIDATGRAQGRAHAQRMSLMYAQIKSQQGALPETFKPADLLPIIEFFYNDAQAAKEKTS
jgi:hypothetical protein